MDPQERATLIAYLHDELDADARTAFEARLRDDAALVARVVAERRAMQQVQQAVQSTLDAAPLPPALTFDRLAPRLRRPRRRPTFAARGYALLGVLGLLLIFVVVGLTLERPEDAGPALSTQTPTATVTPAAPDATPVGLPSATPGRLSIPTRTPPAPTATSDPAGVLRSPVERNLVCLNASTFDC